MTTDDRAGTPGMRAILAVVAGLAALAAAIAFVWGGPGSAFGVAAGGSLAVANLWVFGVVGSGLLSATGAKTPWIALGAVKLVVLFAAVLVLLYSRMVGPLDLALGYLAMPVGITLAHVVFRSRGLDRKRESA
jgi:hypothetical protein